MCKVTYMTRIVSGYYWNGQIYQIKVWQCV